MMGKFPIIHKVVYFSTDGCVVSVRRMRIHLVVSTVASGKLALYVVTVRLDTIPSWMYVSVLSLAPRVRSH